MDALEVVELAQIATWINMIARGELEATFEQVMMLLDRGIELSTKSLKEMQETGYEQAEVLEDQVNQMVKARNEFILSSLSMDGTNPN